MISMRIKFLGEDGKTTSKTGWGSAPHNHAAQLSTGGSFAPLLGLQRPILDKHADDEYRIVSSSMMSYCIIRLKWTGHWISLKQGLLDMQMVHRHSKRVLTLIKWFSVWSHGKSKQQKKLKYPCTVFLINLSSKIKPYVHYIQIIYNRILLVYDT